MKITEKKSPGFLLVPDVTYSLRDYFLSPYYVPGIVFGTGDTAVREGSKPFGGS